VKRRAKFVVLFSKPFDKAWRATVTIDRGSLVFGVKLFRRRRTFELPLELVAQQVAFQVIAAEAKAKREAKAAARKARRR
jgi:hypothetical protein